MSKAERRYERALAALKAIARAIGNTTFRVEDYPGSKLASRKKSSPPGEQRDRPPAPKRAGRDRSRM
jgi:hypothetical protein